MYRVTRNSNKYESDLQNILIDLLPPAESLQKEFYLMDIPEQFKQKKFKTIKSYRESQLKNFIKILQNLYDNNERLVSLAPNSKSTTQQFFNLHENIAKINFRSVEVSCRMISNFEPRINTSSRTGNCNNDNSNSNINLNRLTNIKFKGEFDKVINELLEKCLKTISEVVNCDKTKMKIFSPAAYLPFRCSEFCHFPCKKIEDATVAMDTKYKNLISSYRNKLTETSNYNSDINPVCCFYKRQILGKTFFPFIEQNNIDSICIENSIEEDPTEDPSYFSGNISPHNDMIFDNFYIYCSGNMKLDLEKSIMGITKKIANFLMIIF